MTLRVNTNNVKPVTIEGNALQGVETYFGSVINKLDC